jgi:hypothetical protein
MDIKKYEKEIKSCILSAVSKSTNTFQCLLDLIKIHLEKPATNISELKRNSSKNKGNIFEVLCMMFLKAKGYEVWHLTEVPEDVLKYLNLVSFDLGIDLIARCKIPSSHSSTLDDYFYFPVQVKYRKPTRDREGRTVHRVGWKDISTFLSLVARTGPPKGWMRHVIITNAESVCWRGKKSKKDWTIAKQSFEKASNMFWLQVSGSVTKYVSKTRDSGVSGVSKVDNDDIIINEDEIIHTDGRVEKVTTTSVNQRDLRSKWLDSLRNK